MTGKKDYSRRRALQLMGGVAGGLLLHACNRSSANQRVISYATTKWIGDAPLFIAQEKGFFAEENLRVDSLVFGNLTDQKEALIDNIVEASAFTPITLLKALSLVDKRKDFRIVLVQDLDVGGSTGILAANSIESLEELRGETIAVEEGTLTHFFLLQVLEQVGISESEITLLSVESSTKAAELYRLEDVNAAVTWAPDLYEANEARDDGRIIFDTSMPESPVIADCYVVDNSFLKENPQAVEALIKGTLKGVNFYNENRAEALKIAAPKLETKVEDLDTQLKSLELPGLQRNLELLANPQSEDYLGKHLNDAQQFLSQRGLGNQLPENVESLIEPRFIKALANH
jgi:NitT/TauT family transport system substrate-binding protein